MRQLGYLKYWGLLEIFFKYFKYLLILNFFHFRYLLKYLPTLTCSILNKTTIIKNLTHIYVNLIEPKIKSNKGLINIKKLFSFLSQKEQISMAINAIKYTHFKIFFELNTSAIRKINLSRFRIKGAATLARCLANIAAPLAHIYSEFSIIASIAPMNRR